MAFAAGVRPDAIAAVLTTGAILAVVLKRRGLSLRDTASFIGCLVLPALVLTALWQVKLHSMIGSGSIEPFRKSLPDLPAVASVTSALVSLLLTPGLYGYVFPVVVAGAFMALIPSLPRAGHTGFVVHGLVTLAVALSLWLVFIQLDPSFGGGGGTYLKNSLKRALFYLVPLAAMTSLLSPPILAGLSALDRWQRT
jgi:hypothetical protein